MPAFSTTPTRKLKEVTVTSIRPMKEIGIQETRFDSTALRDNIALSMADILAFNSSVFVKNYGRATLSTVAFRGTSPSHTQVTWNGMRINSPMLGMTDFSTIPAYFIDGASLLHGTSSVNETGGGLGGLVRLSTRPSDKNGWDIEYVQGIGSFSTFDEFLKVNYGCRHWKTSTRIVYSSSANDFTYRNRDKKENIYDDNHNIIGSYYPKEKNRSGAFKDLHILQEAYYDTRHGDRLGINAWFTASNRELPMLTTDYGDHHDFENRQREETLRTLLSWGHYAQNWKTDLRGGYIHTWMAYDYRRDAGNGIMTTMTRSRNNTSTIFGKAGWEFYPDSRWLLTTDISAHQQFVKSSDKNVTTQDGAHGTVGYDRGRIELSGSASVKWQPSKRFGASLVIREDMYGDSWTPIIPALFIDGVIWPAANLTAKASVSRNYRFPTLNDLYFLPGGNPLLKSEQGWSYDAGLSAEFGKDGIYRLTAGVNWFDSRIDDWIMWLPTTKGFFSPRNMKRVHAYGIEANATLGLHLPKGWSMDVNASYSWTPSINDGDKMSPADISVGKQLPYVPRHTATMTWRLGWHYWSVLYKWNFYSKRYTMSSNDVTLSGTLPEYYMSNVSIERMVDLKPVSLSLKLSVNNLFNEEYLSVLSRPMPGINFEFFISISPKW